MGMLVGETALFKYYDTSAPGHISIAETVSVCYITVTFASKGTDHHSEVILLC